jgi:hypothetical protein
MESGEDNGGDLYIWNKETDTIYRFKKKKRKKKKKNSCLVHRPGVSHVPSPIPCDIFSAVLKICEQKGDSDRTEQPVT